ncbi:NAD-dependent epimerase/dehydratase family protein, partial [Candidatus Beckwithbacteria bacterium]|nr:NAD-dependent epimerase/dehydratase family protein [Candidatus Beckwithbacteria bacterium]
IEIFCLDNLYRRGSELSLERLKKYGIKFIYGDIRNKEDLKISTDLVIECSAEPSFTAGITGDTNYLIQTNLNGAINCFDLAKENKADIIFLSTSRVYPVDKINNSNFIEENNRFSLKSEQNIQGVSEKGISEDLSLTGIRSLYGATKYAAEIILNEYSYAFKIKTIINRFGTIAGPWQMGKVDQGIITYWLVSHIIGTELGYFGFGGTGKQVRDILHIDDVFSLLIKQLENINDLSGMTFNIGGGLKNSISIKELTQLCETITGNSIHIKSILKDNDWDLKSYISDTTKIQNFIEWYPQKSVKDIIQDIFNWIQENPNVLDFFRRNFKNKD